MCQQYHLATMCGLVWLERWQKPADLRSKSQDWEARPFPAGHPQLPPQGVQPRVQAAGPEGLSISSREAGPGFVIPGPSWARAQRRAEADLLRHSWVKSSQSGGGSTALNTVSSLCTLLVGEGGEG